MSKPPLKKLPKKKSLGVHVRMHTERFSRKMLSIAVNQRDGGVMVTPLLENWGEITCSQLIVPSSGGLLPDEDSYVTTGADNKPKLHYHRSGMSSVQPAKFEGREGRRTIHLPSMDDLDAVQIFSVTARLPGQLPWKNTPRKGDIFNIMDRPEVRSLLMSGVIYDRNRIPAESIGGLEEGEPVTMASGSHNAVLVDLSGYGLEAVLGLHFNPMPEKLPDFAADFSLVSFHQEHVHSQGAVAIHAGPGIPYAALMHPIPSVEDIHQVAALRPVSSVHENIPPQ
ncbi:hypothetical protein ACT4S5_18800 [Kocuria oceani]|uniref:hypothetical protein n=1 Tax=Kocuria oceani TaxID=988827 RepID=UPI0040354F34